MPPKTAVSSHLLKLPEHWVSSFFILIPCVQANLCLQHPRSAPPALWKDLLSACSWNSLEHSLHETFSVVECGHVAPQEA